jgi:hypothetical protein
MEEFTSGLLNLRLRFPAAHNGRLHPLFILAVRITPFAWVKS